MNEKELKLLKEAFETLSNPSKRKEYDRQLINEMGGNMKKEIDFYLGYEKDVNNYINESDYELERLEDEIRIKFRIPFVEKFIKLIKEHQKAPPGTFEERIYR
jgi:curved DNA-binding protein CbpA